MNGKEFKTKYPEIAKKYEKRTGYNIKNTDWIFLTGDTVKILRSI